MELTFLRMPSGQAPDAVVLPAYATAGSAGMDLSAAIREPMIVSPGQRVMVPTGFAVCIPEAFEGQVRPRSGRAWRDGLTVINAPGTVDSDYRGEVQVLLVNLGGEPVRIDRGDRVAQMVVAPVRQFDLVEVDELPDSDRGPGGFGHTGD